MTFEAILDVSIGLVLIFALFSLLTTTIVELASAMLRRRARMQELGIYYLLDGEGPRRPLFSRLFGGNAYVTLSVAKNDTLAARFYGLESIKALMDRRRLPTYIGADAFVTGVMALVHTDLPVAGDDPDYGAAARADQTGSRLASIIKELFPGKPVGRGELEKRLRAYYKDATDRIVGWYARETQIWLVAVGFLTAVIFNVNVIAITAELAGNATLRERLANAAASDQEIAKLAATLAEQDDGASEDARDYIRLKRRQISEIEQEVSALGLPIGYCSAPSPDRGVSGAAPAQEPPVLLPPAPTLSLTAAPPAPGDCGFFAQLAKPASYFGWLLTAIAISLGAPFWFDLLSKLVAIRRVGKTPADDKGEKEKDAVPGRTGSEGGILPAGAGPADADRSRGGATLTDFEKEWLSTDDVKTVQRLIGAPARNGDLTDPATREAIVRWKEARGQSRPSADITAQMMLDLYGRRS